MLILLSVAKWVIDRLLRDISLAMWRDKNTMELTENWKSMLQSELY